MSINAAASNIDNNINLYNNYINFNSSNNQTLGGFNLEPVYSLCSTNKNSINLMKKQTWILNKLKKEGLNDFALLEIYVGMDVETTFLHTKCNKSFKETPHNFFRRKYKCPYCHCDKFMSHNSNPIAENIDKKQIVQTKMNLIYNGEFEFKGIDPDDKYVITLEHTECKRTFKDYRRKLYTGKITCPYCTDSTGRNNFISNKDKIAFYEEKLDGKFKILEGFRNQKERIQVKRVSCGHTLTKSLNELLRKDYKDNCPECNRLNRLKDFTDRLNDKYKGRFEAINGVEKYKNNQSRLLFLDNKCGNKFVNTFSKLLNTDFKDCPNCSSNTPSITASFKNEVYKKYKGEYIVLDEHIDSTNHIRFKHTKCNHIFYKTKDKFLRAKIPCKECSKKSRSLGIEKAQEKVNNKFGKLFTLKGIYKNSTSDLIAVCNHCGTIEELSLNKLLNRKKCPHCKTAYK